MKFRCIFILVLFVLVAGPAAKASSYGDIFIQNTSVTFGTTTFTQNAKIRIFATVQSNAKDDIKGIVRFYDSFGGLQLGADQPVSVVAGLSDTVFIDVRFQIVGDHAITATIFTFDNEGDDLSNNTGTRTITVLPDADGDGIADAFDPDDDNDGVADDQDAFPTDPTETVDTDGDGRGNNADSDDDNDGVDDSSDAFPVDPTETADTDGDGKGNNSDAFPEDPTETVDFDQDGIGDNADPDADNDGIPKEEDVDDNNQGPQIAFRELKQVIPSGTSFEINLTESVDPDGSIKDINLSLYELEGNKNLIANLPVNLDSPLKLTLDRPGKYEVRVEATDDKGESRVEIAGITVTSILLLRLGIALLLIIIALAIFWLITYRKRDPSLKKLISSSKKPKKRTLRRKSSTNNPKS